jgi:hypothetical protein
MVCGRMLYKLVDIVDDSICKMNLTEREIERERERESES